MHAVRRVPWQFLLAACSFAPVRCVNISALRLEPRIAQTATAFNVSVQAAATLVLANGSFATVTTAAGAIAGEALTTSTRIPGGSATKPFTAVGCLALAERGLLHLDAPIIHQVDPWLRRQGLPTLTQLWGSNHTANLSLVTTRLLLGMQAGLQAYDDASLLQQTIAYPDRDIEPITYITQARKDFLMFMFTFTCMIISACSC